MSTFSLPPGEKITTEYESTLFNDMDGSRITFEQFFDALENGWEISIGYKIGKTEGDGKSHVNLVNRNQEGRKDNFSLDYDTVIEWIKDLNLILISSDRFNTRSIDSRPAVYLQRRYKMGEPTVEDIKKELMDTYRDEYYERKFVQKYG
jgi:hypothetical protein